MEKTPPTSEQNTPAAPHFHTHGSEAEKSSIPPSASGLNSRQVLPRTISLPLLILAIGAVILAGGGATLGYMIGKQGSATQERQTAAQQPAETSPSPLSSPSPSPSTTSEEPLTEGNEQGDQKGGEADQQMRKLSLTRSLNIGTSYPTSAQNPQIDVFLFADLTETTFSGRMLKENIPYLLEAYPGKFKVWYLHTVLNYRDDPNRRAAIGVLKCLDDQGAVWQNMSALVDQQGRPDFIYTLKDREQYIRCITEINSNSRYFDNQVSEGQLRMQELGFNGVPTAIFTVPGKEKTVTILGALPLVEFKQQVEDALVELGVE